MSPVAVMPVVPMMVMPVMMPVDFGGHPRFVLHCVGRAGIDRRERLRAFDRRTQRQHSADNDDRHDLCLQFFLHPISQERLR